MTFPLRAEFVTPQVVARLKPHGSVSIWNDPRSYVPDDEELETRRFREMGVDGMIDLRGKDEPFKDPAFDFDILPPELKFPWNREKEEALIAWGPTGALT